MSPVAGIVLGECGVFGSCGLGGRKVSSWGKVLRMTSTSTSSLCLDLTGCKQAEYTLLLSQADSLPGPSFYDTMDCCTLERQHRGDPYFLKWCLSGIYECRTQFSCVLKSTPNVSRLMRGACYKTF